MAGGSNGAQKEQKVRVDDIARDDRLLEAKAKELTGEDVTLSPTNVEVHDLDSVDWNTACALLVQIGGGVGAVYIHGNQLDIVMTGPDRGNGSWLIGLEQGQSCRFYGQPSVRYFRRQV
ncbi:hypothetical protein N7494_005406 [Penicillium frequentans]|uniref:Uncharacterized protein n=1 Tax=Penicillium frequentans TaxID=3151616 RepID=A0AAD6GHE3_9EURO|nr:hypothetical protein N7494_005406 [Penicillium glabrum]